MRNLSRTDVEFVGQLAREAGRLALSMRQMITVSEKTGPRDFVTEADIALGVPSLWVWQAFFWIIGVLLVWWLAYRSRLSTVEGAFRPHELRHLRQVPGTRRQLRWIALLVTRLTARQNRTTQPARRLR